MAQDLLTILIIDDSPDDRLLLRTALRSSRTKRVVIHEVESGAAGLAACHAGTPVFDMILLDLNLPDMHGLELIDTLRGHHELVHFPLIILTGTDFNTTAQEALNRGAQDFITKEELVPVSLMRIITNGIERFRLLQRLQASEVRYRTLAAVAPVGIFRTDLAGDYLYVNERWCEFAGLGAAEAHGKGWANALHPDDRLAVSTAWYQAAANNAAFQLEYRFLGPNEEVTWLYGQADVEHDPQGVPIGYIGTITDITERKTMEDLLQDTNKRLEQQVSVRTAELARSNQELNQFAYVASHDLKAPLRGINHLAQWITEDTVDFLPPASQEHLQKLRGRIKRMEKLLDDLLMYSRAGRLNGSVSSIDFAKLIADILLLLAPPPGFSITYDSEPMNFATYQVPLEVVLRNLIGNAIKHHHRTDGKIHICMKQEELTLHFTVCDDGPGIAEEFHERIFGMFQTLEPRDTIEGSGIGLSVVKKTVESLGGSVGLSSRTGEGTTFSFSWPLKQVSSDQAPA